MDTTIAARDIQKESPKKEKEHFEPSFDIRNFLKQAEGEDSKEQHKLQCSDCNFLATCQEAMEDHKRNLHLFPKFFSFIKDKGQIQEERTEMILCDNIKDETEIEFEKKVTGTVLIECIDCENLIPHDKCSNKTGVGEEETLKEFECKECGKIYLKKENLTQHINSVHMKEVRYRCSVCEFKSYRRNHIGQHQQVAHRNEKYRTLKIGCLPCTENREHKCGDQGDFLCDRQSCDFRTTTEKYLRRHIEVCHLKLLKFACNICDKKSVRIDTMRNHQKNHHQDSDCFPEKILCQQCSDGDTHSNCLYIKTGPVVRWSIKCTECLFNTTKKLDLKNHMLSEHSDRIKKQEAAGDKFQCEDCEKAFSRKYLLDQHVKSVHEGVVRYQCNLCEFKSYHWMQASRHAEAAHVGQKYRITKMDCNKCENDVEHKKCSIDGTRMKRRTRKGKHKCDECEFSTDNNPIYLKHHVSAKHEGLVRFYCGVCGFKAYFKRKVRVHIQKSHADVDIHQNILRLSSTNTLGDSKISDRLEKSKRKPKKVRLNKKSDPAWESGIKCEKCDFRSHNNQSLVNHFNSLHLNILNYGCNICDRKSYFKYVIRQHQKTKHVDQICSVVRLVCGLCGVNEEHKDCSAKKMRKGTEKMEIKKKIEDVRMPTMQCKFCDLKVASTMFMRDHLQEKHSDKMIYKCSMCDYKSTSGRVIRYHLKKNHKGEARYLRLDCSLCASKVSHDRCQGSEGRKLKGGPDGTDQETSVINRTQPTEGFPCSFSECDFISINEKSLQRHKESLHDKILRFGCNYCDKKSFYKEVIKAHQKTRHKDKEDHRVEKIECKLCKSGESHKECVYTAKETSVIKTLRIKKKNRTPPTEGIPCSFSECDFISINEKSLQNHKESLHDKILKFGCNYCDKRSFYIGVIKYHQKSRHKDKDDHRVEKIECKLCKSGESHIECVYTAREQAPGRHRPNYNYSAIGPKLYHCEMEKCDYQSDLRHTLQQHVYTTHMKIKRYACSLCPSVKSYFSKVLEKHIKRNHADTDEAKIKTIGCEKCDNMEIHPKCVFKMSTECAIPDFLRNLESRSIGRGHDILRERRNYGGQAQKVKCEICEEIFPSNKMRVTHYKAIHPGKKIFKCKSCKYSSNWLPNVNSHTASIHENLELTCELCGWKTKWNPTFLDHMRTVHGVVQRKSKSLTEDKQNKSYLCDECGFSTDKYKNMTNHRGKHRAQVSRDQGKLFSCTKCPFKTKHQNSLFVHRRSVHEGLKYKCPKCSFENGHKVKLREHMEHVHDGVSFSCPFCTHKTIARYNLKLHLKHIHSDKEYKEEDLKKTVYKSITFSNQEDLKQSIKQSSSVIRADEIKDEVKKEEDKSFLKTCNESAMTEKGSITNGVKIEVRRKDGEVLKEIGKELSIKDELKHIAANLGKHFTISYV